jgi:hypothetical protein
MQKIVSRVPPSGTGSSELRISPFRPLAKGGAVDLVTITEEILWGLIGSFHRPVATQETDRVPTQFSRLNSRRASGVKRGRGGNPAQKLSDIRGLCWRLHEREAEPQSFFAQRRDIPVSGPPFIFCGAEVAEGRPMREHVVDDPGNLVGCSHDG